MRKQTPLFSHIYIWMYQFFFLLIRYESIRVIDLPWKKLMFVHVPPIWFMRYILAIFQCVFCQYRRVNVLRKIVLHFYLHLWVIIVFIYSLFFVYFHYILWRMDKWNNFLLFLGVFLDDVLTANLRSFRYYFELIVRSCSINVINKNDFTWFFLIRLSIMLVCHGKWGLIGNVLQMDFSLYFGMVQICLWHIILVDKIKKKYFNVKGFHVMCGKIFYFL